MSARREDTVQIVRRWPYSPRLHAILYALLLIATPFILLQGFLVDWIGYASRYCVPVGEFDVPVVPTLAAIVFLVLAIVFRKQITPRLVVALAIAVGLIAIAQQITDYYFDHNFYDLQQNWHYLAYGLFAFVLYRDLSTRGYSVARMVLLTFLISLGLSAFDEFFQRHLSNRVFDISDIAKDVCGVLMGMVLLYGVGPARQEFLHEWHKLRHKRLRDYLDHPMSLMVLQTLLAFILLTNASLLSDFRHWPIVIMLTAIGFVCVFLVLHLSQYRPIRWALTVLLVATIGVQAWAFVHYRNDNIVHAQRYLTIYKGIPIVFYDVLIFPDGTFRLVDKKHYFNRRDQRFLLKRKPDILLIASGWDGVGGRGFETNAPVQFIYNQFTEHMTQVLILPTPQAYETFNRLKREGKNVLLVLHSSC